MLKEIKEIDFDFVKEINSSCYYLSQLFISKDFADKSFLEQADVAMLY